MHDKNRTLRLWLSVVLTSLTLGCSSAAHSIARRPEDQSHTPTASGPTVPNPPVYLAQTTCWNTMSCCILRFPTTAAQSCGATAVEIAEVLNGAKFVHGTTQTADAKVQEEPREQEDAKAAEAAEAEGVAAPEPPDCQGQNHHVISRPIAKVLERHKTLRGLYAPRDERFKARAKDKESHCGYQHWHRDVDLEVIQWLRRYDEATKKEFEAFLRELYNRPDMLNRFPHGF